MKKVEIRLALRHEGNFWNAYLTKPGTMEGAHLIGSIMFGAIQNNTRAKDVFMGLMMEILGDAAQAVTGERPIDFEIGPAPEGERSGHA